VAETTHARSRRASLVGLVLQIIATAATFALSLWTNAAAIHILAVYVAGGIPLWFAALLVFRQRELAELEALDLEELRKERQAAGGGEAMFGEKGAGGLGFMVAQTRLAWMQRWLIPGFGLLSAVYLIGVGVLSWRLLDQRPDHDWQNLRSIELGMVLSTLIMLLLYFYSRYASGLARISGWQLLRGCGSFMSGTAYVTLAVIIALGYYLYQGSNAWERFVAYAIPATMVILGGETFINFLLDIYRPRSPGVEPRACFDSRLLGLFSEPGGFAHSVAEAINYQFGFKVSQTWFYQLLQRTFIPLAGVGVLVVWLLSCFIVVQPYEHAIIERFGRQIDPEHPLEAGLHLKWPAPFEICRKYNTEQLHDFYIGYQEFDRPVYEAERDPSQAWIELWTDARHGGRKHFDFIIAPTPNLDDVQDDERAIQHLTRMLIVVQYSIRPEGLVDFTQHVEDPHGALYKAAWNEVVRFAASNHIDDLLSEARDDGGELLRTRIVNRTEELGLGLDIKYVGLLQVHPTKQVAEAFRGVVTAQQEKIAEIRKARVTENQILSRVAGDKLKALALSQAIDAVQENELRRGDLERELLEVAPRILELKTGVDELRSSQIASLDARWRLDLARHELARILKDFNLGLGGSLQDQVNAEQAVADGETAASRARKALAEKLQPVRKHLLENYSAETIDLWLEFIETDEALVFWNAKLEEYLSGLEGVAAVVLAEAQARRWELEMRADAEVSLLANERYAFAAAPEIYKARSYLQVLTEGVKEARKYFLAFDPGGAKVHIRLETQEEAVTDITDFSMQATE